MSWISIPKVEGTASRQAHADLPPNTFERELGREGFYGPATQMYHRHPPTGWLSVEGPLKPRAFDTANLKRDTESPWDTSVLFHNQHLQIRYLTMSNDMDHLVRNGDGDELIFVHRGSGELYCDYGHLKFSEGDYLVMPRGAMWRITIAEPGSIFVRGSNRGQLSPPRQGHGESSGSI